MEVTILAVLFFVDQINKSQQEMKPNPTLVKIKQSIFIKIKKYISFCIPDKLLREVN